MRARTGLWEPWGGNAPGPPGHLSVTPVSPTAGSRRFEQHSNCGEEAHAEARSGKCLSDGPRGNSVNNSSRRLNGETRQEWSRVGRWRGGLGVAYLFPALSSAGASIAQPCSVSTLPLIKPDVRISRIRLSDKDSCLRPRDVAVAQAELDKAQLPVKVLIGIA